MPDDVQSKPPETERKREWAHRAGPPCDLVGEPVFTEPGKIPPACPAPSCGSEEWRSVGIVERDKATKKVLTRNGEKVKA